MTRNAAASHQAPRTERQGNRHPPGRARSSFGDLLRYWRGKRRMSQLELALAGEISQRHVSFLESGRANPSRTMVFLLGNLMDVPLRHQNLMLQAAGFAPAFRESDLEEDELAAVRQALAFILKSQEPYPAIVVDRGWNLLMQNAASTRLLAGLLGPPAPGSEPPNVFRLTLDPAGLRRFITNWEEVAAHLAHRIHQELDAMGPHDPGAAELEDLLSAEGMPEKGRVLDWAELPGPTLNVGLEINGVRAAFFTTITTLGTAVDVTLQDLRIETWYPADEATAALFQPGGPFAGS
ncbi:MAG: helix-turn-helix transcriptional regulator [Sneathiellaceae bacterium]